MITDENLYDKYTFDDFNYQLDFSNAKLTKKDTEEYMVKELGKRLFEIKINKILHQKLPNIVPAFYSGNVYVSSLIPNKHLKGANECDVVYFFKLQTVVEKADVGNYYFINEIIKDKENLINYPFKLPVDDYMKEIENYYEMLRNLDDYIPEIPEYDEMLQNIINYKLIICNLQEEEDFFESDLDDDPRLILTAKMLTEYKTKPNDNFLTKFIEGNNVFVTSLFRALKKIHKQGYIHGDVKDDNIAWNGRDGIKLIDFGMSFMRKEFKERMMKIRTAFDDTDFAKNYLDLYKKIVKVATTPPKGYENTPSYDGILQYSTKRWTYDKFISN